MTEKSGTHGEDAAICGRRSRWRGGGSATPGPIRRRLRDRARTAASSAAAGPRRAAARTPRPTPWKRRARRRAARRSTSRSNPAAIGARTPPCADALIAAGVARVVRDAGSRSAGEWARASPGCARRASRSRRACCEEAAEINRRLPAAGARGRPLFHLKLASTLDGRIATRIGREPLDHRRGARAARPRLRGRHDAVLVGVGTVLADDPELTCRLPGIPADPGRPDRVVEATCARRSRSQLVATAHEDPIWLADPRRRRSRPPRRCGEGVQ